MAAILVRGTITSRTLVWVKSKMFLMYSCSVALNTPVSCPSATMCWTSSRVMNARSFPLTPSSRRTALLERVRQGDHDPADPLQEMNRPGDPEGHGVGILQADGLGDQFPDDQDEVGNDDDHDA